MGRNISKGFTLIELLCLLAIIGIVSSIAYPSLSYLVKADRLRLSSKILVNDLRYAKMYAVAKSYNATIKVKFIGASGSEIYKGYRISNTANLTNDKLKETYFYPGIIIDGWRSTFASDESENTIEFFSNGSVSRACTIVLKDTETGETKNITLTIGYTRIMEIEK